MQGIISTKQHSFQRKNNVRYRIQSHKNAHNKKEKFNRIVMCT